MQSRQRSPTSYSHLAALIFREIGMRRKVHMHAANSIIILLSLLLLWMAHSIANLVCMMCVIVCVCVWSDDEDVCFVATRS